MASSLVANPWLWAGLAGFALGLSLGEGLRWVIARLRKDDGRGARASALTVLFLALALAAAACLLVFPPKGALLAGSLYIWASVLLVLGFLASAWPPVGLPLALVLILASAGLVLDARKGWVALEGPGPVARVTPFAREGKAWKGELILYDRDSVPTTLPVSFQGEGVALVVERLDLEGPASILGPSRAYRVAGLAGGEGREATFAARFSARMSLVERFEPLGEAPVSGPVGYFVRRSRLVSPALPSRAFEPGYFAFVEGEGAAAEGRELVLAASEKPF